MTASQIKDRIQNLREAMKRASVDILIVPSTDPHLSEYIPDHWKCREYYSGFTGSAGTLVVGKERASLWVDSRYWEQAEIELDGTDIEICRVLGPGHRDYGDWIVSYFPAETKVGIDGRLISIKQERELKSKLEKSTISLVSVTSPVEETWLNRPLMPDGIVFEHSEKYCGLVRQEKICQLQEKLKEEGVEWILTGSLDEIAWLLNLRGNDIEYTPVFVSYLLIGLQSVKLFISEQKLPYTVQQKLAEEGIEIIPYESVIKSISELEGNTSLWIDPQYTSWEMVSQLPRGVKVVEKTSPITLTKAKKAPAELDFIRDVMLDDGAAFCEFQAWFDEVQDRGVVISEMTVAEKIEVCRSRREDYISPSFGTIAGFNENAALPHYQASKESFSIIKNNGLLLIDTGGQYLRGTTDMTRVIPVGVPSKEQKRDFTLVLKSVIALSTTHFPRSVPAPVLDSIARKPLWDKGIDFGHGTGHGVGYFLNVHEGPQAISYRGRNRPENILEEGMVTSIEPGIYRPGKWGIRIENLSVAVAGEKTEFGDFLHFETLTKCPIDTRCIEVELLDATERAWLNNYHAEVREKLLPRIAIKARDWLFERTQPI